MKKFFGYFKSIVVILENYLSKAVTLTVFKFS